MKITFTTPLAFTDGSPIPPADLLNLKYIVFVDTVKPPVKNYPVPDSVVAAGVANADGSKTLTVDAATDLSVPLVHGTTYYIAVEDLLGNEISPETTVVNFTVSPGVPQAPTGLSVE